MTMLTNGMGVGPGTVNVTAVRVNEGEVRLVTQPIRATLVTQVIVAKLVTKPITVTGG